MPLTPPLIYADLAASRASGGFPFAGVNFDRLAWAVSYGIASWLQSGGWNLQGVCTGTAGAGTINTPVTRLVLAPNPGLILAGLAGAGMSGPLSASLATVAALGFAKTVSSYGQYSGVVTGVGVGTDVSVAGTINSGSLIAQLNAYMSAMLGPGPAVPMMATGLGQGMASMAATVTGTGSVVGAGSVVPATGQSTSVVV